MSERTPFLKALVGSHNYNLQVPTSDYDYKFFVLPTFEDMFFNRDFKKSFTKDGDDFEYKDARQLPELWWKTNVNFTEILFSNDITLFPETKEYMEALLARKEDIARMNLPYLHKSSLGMVKTKLKLADRNYYYADATQSHSGSWGKEMMGAYRIADFFMRYYANGFESFGSAMTYSDEERPFLLSFRNEGMSFVEAKNLVHEKEKELLAVRFDYSELDGLNTRKFVEETLQKAVAESVTKELSSVA